MTNFWGTLMCGLGLGDLCNAPLLLEVHLIYDQPCFEEHPNFVIHESCDIISMPLPPIPARP